VTTVTDARTGAETDLAVLLQQLQEQARTGTLKLSGDDGQVKYVYLKRGTIELLKTNRSRTLLGKALLKRRKLTDEQLRSALERQKAASSKLRLGEILVGMGIVLESDVHQALAYQIAEEIFELFGRATLRSEFYRGEPPLDIFESEDLQARVSLSPVQLTREAIRRQNELVDIKRTLASLRDVYALTPAAYAKAEAEQNPAIQEVVASIDNLRNVSEVLDVVRAPDLVALRMLAKMVQDGEAVALSAQDLIALGQELEDRAEYDRARERYLRAEELGHPDFDLPRRIGQIAEAMSDKPEACRRYVVYADRCVQAGYPDVATLTLGRVLELDPNDVEARERLAELLARTAGTLAEAGDPGAAAKAAEAGAQYEHLLAITTAPGEQRRLLGALIALLPDREDLRERMADVSIALGDPGQAVQDLQDLAIHSLEAGNLERATATLQKILQIDPDDLLALQSLAITYQRQGRKEDAVREFLRLARTLEESGLAVASADRMVEIYEKVVELDPANAQARRFLAHAYDDKKEADKAIANYASIAQALRGKGNDEELLAALDKLVGLKPNDQELALERAQLLRKLGRGGESLGALKQLAEAASKQGDAAAAQSAWNELLAQVPGDLDAHLAIARLEGQSKETAKAAGRRYAAVFELALVAGKDDLAEEAIRRAIDLELDPQPEQRERLARIQALRGQPADAAKTLVRAARRARDDENLGQAQTWIRRALELDATCEDALELRDALKRSPVAAAATPAPSLHNANVSLGPSVAPSIGMADGDEQRQVIHATITGGAPTMSIESFKSKGTRKIGGIAERLRNAMSGGGPSAPVAPEALDGGGASTAQAKAAGGEAPDPALSRKASSAMNRLRALKGGGGGSGPSAGASAEPTPEAPAAPISKGPEGPGEVVDDGLAKKASSAMNRLKAMKSGGGAGSEPAAAPLPNGGGAPQQLSKGPEGPGEVVDDGLAKKASSAMNRLKAMKGGGGAPAPAKPAGQDDQDPPASAPAPTTPSPTPAGGQQVSKGPEAPGEAVDDGLAKKATSAMSRLKALKSGGAPASEPGGAPLPANAGQPQVSKGPEAPGEAVDQGLAKKATSAMSRLKALKTGGGGPTSDPVGAPLQNGGPPPQVAKGPEAPGEAVDQGLAKKATSAMSRLKALKSGGGAPADGDGAPPAAALSQPISKGPEAAGEAVDAGLAKKASSAMNRLKALKSGGGGAPPPPPPPPAPDGSAPAAAASTSDSDSAESSAFGTA
jgi:tetratricopeptide (TPR) repeat protein